MEQDVARRVRKGQDGAERAGKSSSEKAAMDTY